MQAFLGFTGVILHHEKWVGVILWAPNYSNRFIWGDHFAGISKIRNFWGGDNFGKIT